MTSTNKNFVISTETQWSGEIHLKTDFTPPVRAGLFAQAAFLFTSVEMMKFIA
jgi:hypothetical protein